MRIRFILPVTLVAALLPAAVQPLHSQATAPGSGVRLRPSEYAEIPISGRAVWAASVDSFTSQYDTEKGARQILGPPNVFPRAGDIGAWTPRTWRSAEDAITVRFPATNARQIWIFETYTAGALHQVFDMSGGRPVLLWSGAPAAVGDATTVRALKIDLREPRVISALRLVVNPAAVGDYPALDAVALVP